MMNRLPWLILLFGGIVTVWSAGYVTRQIDREARIAFEGRAHDFEANLERRLRSYEDILFGVLGLYEATPEVTPEMFRRYAASLNMKERYPALGAVNFAEHVDAGEREEFLRAFEKDHGSSPRDIPTPELPDGRNEYMVINRSYPTERPGLGTEVLASPRRLQTNTRNMSTTLKGSDYQPFVPVGSGMPIRPAGQPHVALALRLGVFRPDADGKPKLIGTAGIGFALPILLQEALPAAMEYQPRFRLETIGRTDGKVYDPPVLLYQSEGPEADQHSPAAFRTAFDIALGGAILRTHISQSKDRLLGVRDRALPVINLVVGFILFGTLALAARRLLNANSKLEGAVTERTFELRRELERTRALEREVAHIAEEERRRIGHELHDNLGQRLTGVSLSAEALAASLSTENSPLADHAHAIGNAVSEAISEVRGLAHGLMPVAAGAEGLRDALMRLAESASQLPGIHCAFDFDDPVDICDEVVAANLYRIAQEALNNALRHSGARSIATRLDYAGEKVMLSIADNGSGFAYDAEHGHDTASAGLRIMRYRASVINYELKIESDPGRGTTITVIQC
jgi:signal transduction histidine kinase